MGFFYLPILPLFQHPLQCFDLQQLPVITLTYTTSIVITNISKYE
jgi:hypothetical protein